MENNSWVFYCVFAAEAIASAIATKGIALIAISAVEMLIQAYLKQ